MNSWQLVSRSAIRNPGVSGSRGVKYPWPCSFINNYDMAQPLSVNFYQVLHNFNAFIRLRFVLAEVWSGITSNTILKDIHVAEAKFCCLLLQLTMVFPGLKSGQGEKVRC